MKCIMKYNNKLNEIKLIIIIVSTIRSTYLHYEYKQTLIKLLFVLLILFYSVFLPYT